MKKKILKLVLKLYKKYIYVFSIITFSFYRFFNIKVSEYKKSTDLQRIGFIDQDGLIHIPSEFCSYVNTGDLYVEGWEIL